MFKPVSSRVSFPQLEEEVLKFWRERDIHRRSEVEKLSDAPRFMLFEGPPTANGSPGIHHVLSRVFKDVIPRYKTMQGYRPLRKGGWDTHGLPVELEVEKELGISTKQQIEEYGVEAFNARCRESVFRYVQEWEAMTERVGFWIDMKNPYVTLDKDYIETCWWIFKQLWNRGLVYRGVKGTPHCPRCVTSLSSHEVALGYQENTPDPSIYIKFLLKPTWWEGAPEKPAAFDTLFSQGQGEAPTFVLAWTTTPWTLPGNTALAVNPDADYALVELQSQAGRERLLLAAALLDDALPESDYQVLATLPGRDLEHLVYEPLYDPWRYGAEVRQFLRRPDDPRGATPRLEPVDQYTWRVVAADLVSLEDGTGVVHIAPSFGDEDLDVGRKEGLAFIQPVDLQGVVTGTYPFAGRFVKEADEEVMQELASRYLLYRRDVYYHTYPFCWRCETPLLYYAKESWYIATTARKERLVSGNQEIHWYPAHIQEGRFGEWLRNNVDWAISRERYWGTPLPIWQCPSCQRYDCIGSLDELRTRMAPADGATGLEDLHRPSIDAVLLACPDCGASMRRVPEVMDCWFDSGAMPVAQWHYPLENQGIFEDGRFPADYICEAVDQTRGWFYSLHALSTLLFDQPSYRNVICLGLILDEQGEKMSKSKGNVVDPWEVIQAHGADPLRWYLFTATTPGNARRFSSNLVGEMVRRFFLTLWNTYSFFVTYANIDGYDPATAPPVEPTAELDRWALSELNTLVAQVTALLDEYNPTDAGRRIQEFVEELSNWYVRRSRRRFWKSENDQDKASAYATLYRCLATLAHLMAPLTPFLAEEMYQNLVRSVDPQVPESVHLAPFPKADPSLVDEGLSRATGLAIRVASLGRAARSKARIRVRQPLRRALVKTRARDEEALLVQVAAQVLDELNVKEMAILEDEAQVLEFRVRLNPAVAGPRYGQEAQHLARTLEQGDTVFIARRVQAGAAVDLGGQRLQPDDLLVEPVERPGYAVAQEGGYLVALETELTPELRDEGFARELVHRIQNLRRSAGFDIADHITLWYQGSPRVRQVMERFGDYVRQETLGDQLVEGTPEADAHAETVRLEGEDVAVGVRRV